MNLIFYYTRENRHSLNALAGALEKAALPGLQLFFPVTEKELLERTAECLKTRGATAAGFSFFTSQLPHIRKTAAHLRERFGARLILLAGGPHPSGDPEGTLALGFDHVTAGDGEEAVIKLARSLLKGVKPRGKILRPGPVELDDWPPYSLKWGKFGPIEITRGCPFGCSYCQTSYLFGRRPRHRSVENVLSHIALMKSEEMCDIRVVTPDAFAYGSPDGNRLNLPALEALLKGARAILGKEGRLFFGGFPSEVRPDHVTEGTLALARRYSDSKRLVIGAQSGSPRMLSAIRRRHTAADIHRAVRLALGAGFGADVDFILGLPGETAADAAMTLDMMEALVKLGARIHAHTFMPLPGTPYARRPPERLNGTTLRRLRSLVARGHAFGQWEKQRELGRTAAAGTGKPE